MTAEVLLRHYADGLVHGLVVVCGGDDQIAVAHQVVVVHAVVVDERAARGFEHAYGF